jgi:hypothetical protein
VTQNRKENIYIAGIMMTALFIAAVFLVFVAGIGKWRIMGPAFKIGECFALTSQVDKKLEAWEKENLYTVEMVVEYGKENYHTVVDYRYNSLDLTESTSNFEYDNIMTRVECTQPLKDLKKELFN